MARIELATPSTEWTPYVTIIFSQEEAQAFRDLIGGTNSHIREDWITEKQDKLLFSAWNKLDDLMRSREVSGYNLIGKARAKS